MSLCRKIFGRLANVALPMAYRTVRHHHQFETWWRDEIRNNPANDPKTSWSIANQAFFIHIPKTAGTSLYRSLGMSAITYTHVPARVIREHYPDEFAKYFVFTVVRNPWDRLVSTYEFLLKGTVWRKQQLWAQKFIGDSTFEQFVLRLGNDRLYRNAVMSENFFFSQSYFLTDRAGTLLVDQIYKFEDLDEAFSDLCSRFSVEQPLGHERRSERAPYVNYYSDKTAAIVGKLYRDDIARFGYTFPNSSKLVPSRESHTQVE